MGRLLKELMEDKEEQYHTPDPEMIPELMLLGTLEHRELSLQSGRVVHLEVIMYNGRNYVIKQTEKGKWFGEYAEISRDDTDVYDTVRW